MKTTATAGGTMSKTATKREAARLQREINARQKQLDSLRSRPGDFGGGYGTDPATGKPTLCQQLVDEMVALSRSRRSVLGIPEWA